MNDTATRAGKADLLASTAPTHDVYLSGPEVDRRYAMSPATRYRRVQSGALPPPVFLAPGARPRWKLADLLAMEERAKAQAQAQEAETADAA